MSCRLSIVSLGRPPEYRALSYVWGDASVTKLTLVDDVPFTVRVNLWDFLAQMQEEEFTGILWIDAICINQGDLK